MDSFNLRIIANPYLLKKEKIKSKNIFQIEIENNNLLYQYLEKKYKNLYINPILYYNIINRIDEVILNYEVETILSEIIDGVICKFDN